MIVEENGVLLLLRQALKTMITVRKAAQQNQNRQLDHQFDPQHHHDLHQQLLVLQKNRNFYNLEMTKLEELVDLPHGKSLTKYQ